MDRAEYAKVVAALRTQYELGGLRAYLEVVELKSKKQLAVLEELVDEESLGDQ